MTKNIFKILFMLFFFSMIFCGFIASALRAENLPTPGQIIPEQGADVKTLRPEFIWSSVSTASYYSFQLTTDVTFLNLEDNIYTIIKNNLIDTAYITEVELLPDTLYFWRVSARTSPANTSIQEKWSSIRYFKTPKNSGIFSNFNSQLEIKIFPNPVVEIAQININNLKNNRDHNRFFLYLFDMNGSLIEKIDDSKTRVIVPTANKISNYSQNIFSLNCEKLQSGIYTVFLFDEKNKILAVENFSVAH